MAEQFSGQIDIRDSDSRRTIELDGDTGIISAGGNEKRGHILLFPQDGDLTRLNTITVDLDGQEANLKLGGNQTDGRIILNNRDSDTRLHLDAGASAVTVRDANGRAVFHFDGTNASLSIGGQDNEGGIIVHDANRRTVFNFNGRNAALSIGGQDNGGEITVHDANGNRVFHFDGTNAALSIGGQDNEGDIIVRDVNGSERIRLDGDTGDIRLSGADCAEEFDVAEFEAIDPGTVLVIDDDINLHPCKIPYDKKVAGVVSGGNGFNPGIILDKHPTRNKRLPIALNGKVYCKVDAEYAPVEVGDLLTTSPTPGHAMKASDPLKAFGAVIGKALCDLQNGRDLIPILVSLQ